MMIVDSGLLFWATL